MLFNIVAVALSCAAYASAVTIDIAVGKGGLVFTPPTTTPAVGDVLKFTFYGNHSVTSSSFSDPCTPSTGNNSFNSKIQSPNVTFSVKVATTAPLWYFCEVRGHCQLGMVGAANAPTTGNSTYANFKAKAEKTPISNITTTGTATATSQSSTASASKKGAANLRYSTGLSAISAVVVVGMVGVAAGATL